MSAINPYLTFDGTCRQAFEFYQSVFGGEFSTISQFKDIPSEQEISAEDGQKIMHVALPIGQNVLMGSDRMAVHGKGTVGDNISISFLAESEKEADRIFNGLSGGGQVTMPLQKTFWNAYFGMLTDKFGLHWMINHDY